MRRILTLTFLMVLTLTSCQGPFGTAKGNQALNASKTETTAQDGYWPEGSAVTASTTTTAAPPPTTTTAPPVAPAPAIATTTTSTTAAPVQAPVAKPTTPTTVKPTFRTVQEMLDSIPLVDGDLSTWKGAPFTTSEIADVVGDDKTNEAAFKKCGANVNSPMFKASTPATIKGHRFTHPGADSVNGPNILTAADIYSSKDDLNRDLALAKDSKFFVCLIDEIEKTPVDLGPGVTDFKFDLNGKILDMKGFGSNTFTLRISGKATYKEGNVLKSVIICQDLIVSSSDRILLTAAITWNNYTPNEDTLFQVVNKLRQKAATAQGL